jgi:hypothetical protein
MATTLHLDGEDVAAMVALREYYTRRLGADASHRVASHMKRVLEEPSEWRTRKFYWTETRTLYRVRDDSPTCNNKVRLFRMLKDAEAYCKRARAVRRIIEPVLELEAPLPNLNGPGGGPDTRYFVPAPFGRKDIEIINNNM